MVDILGREQDITRTYPDGSFDCPFCSCAVIAPAERCENPWCPASSAAMANPSSRAAFQAKVDEHARAVAEQERRRRDHEQAMARIAEDRERRDAVARDVRATAEASGKCVRCALYSLAHGARVVYTKHRGGCPRA